MRVILEGCYVRAITDGETNMNQNDYYKLLGRLEGLRETLDFINNNYTQNIINCKIQELESQIKTAVVTDEVAELKAENELLKSAMSEIRKHTTGTRALEVALAKIKELEDKQCDCKEKARGLVEEFMPSSHWENDFECCVEILEKCRAILKQKFNLGE